MDCRQKKKKEKLYVGVAVPPAPARLLSQCPHALSVTSVTSVDYWKFDNDLLTFTSWMRKSPENLGDRLMKAMRSVMTSSGVPYFQMTSTGSPARQKRDKEYIQEDIFSHL